MIKHSCKFYGAESRDRKRLREWLIDMVDSNTVHGLRWLDQERKTFRITWKHAGKPDFELEKDAVLFREWAKHTGKYKDGEQPDPSTWKTRFRCALHKMPDVEEVKVPHSLDHPTEPFRVFKILPKSKGSQSPKRSPSSPKPGSPKLTTGRVPKETCREQQPISGGMFGPPSACHSSYELKGKYFFGDQLPSISDQRSQSNSSCDDPYDDLENITPTIGYGLYPSDYAQEVTVSTCNSPPYDNGTALTSQGGQFCSVEKKPCYMNTMTVGNQFSYNFYPSFSIQNKLDYFAYPNVQVNAPADFLQMEVNALLSLQADM